ncbi:MAG: GIY-YIG nuclease family protein, partial [Patescibacteria group bacterium]
RGVEKRYLVPHSGKTLFMFYTYIIQSESTGKYYIGSTQNIEERIVRHNGGRSEYTKNRGPWKIKHTEEFPDLSSARKREYFIKKQKSKKYIETLIAG